MGIREPRRRPATTAVSHHAPVSPRSEPTDLGSDDTTSRSLLLRVRANDQEAWRRLVDLYSPLVAHWCRQWGASADDLADLVQEVFAAVSPGLATYRPDRPGATFRGWLRGVARNKLRWLAVTQGLVLLLT